MIDHTNLTSYIDIWIRKSFILPLFVEGYVVDGRNAFLHRQSYPCWLRFIRLQIRYLRRWFRWNCLIIWLQFNFRWLTLFFLFQYHWLEFGFIDLLQIFCVCEFFLSFLQPGITLFNIGIRHNLVVSSNVGSCAWMVALFRIFDIFFINLLNFLIVGWHDLFEVT